MSKEKKLIRMDGSYVYRGSREKATILTVERPKWGDLLVISMDSMGSIHSHDAQGNFYPVGRKSCSLDLIEVSPWDNIEIDAKVLVWDNCDMEKVPRHFAGISADGRPMTWHYLGTSWTTKGKVCWDNCKLVDSSSNIDGGE